MPPRSQSATPGSRTGSQTSSDHPPRDGHKQRSSGSNRAKTCRPKPGFTSHGFDKVPSSGGFRISSTPPQNIKLDRKINAAHNNSAKTTPKEGTSGNGGGSGGRGSGGFGNKCGGSGIGGGLSGNGKEGCGNRLGCGGSGCGSGGNGSGSDGSKSSGRGLSSRGSGSRSENGMRSSGKQVFTVPAQLTMKPRKPSLATNPDIFKRFGGNSESYLF
ncbi:hypothetical protein PoB_004241800 [Plakobranchus ocellatus]|uniref:Uncharacterized protein n=1 Tax=Plakobranchus ocellatus TaxID=259542 RepID=A0AAV4BAS5_9GAST|nr:hypothetical protein PoB_004241800 [Plakobranchus ocellatus]